MSCYVMRRFNTSASKSFISGLGLEVKWLFRFSISSHAGITLLVSRFHHGKLKPIKPSSRWLFQTRSPFSTGAHAWRSFADLDGFDPLLKSRHEISPRVCLQRRQISIGSVQPWTKSVATGSSQQGSYLSMRALRVVFKDASRKGLWFILHMYMYNL